MSDDRHSPTTAGPTPEPALGPAREPTPTVPVTTATPAGPAGTAPDEPPELPFGIPPEHPEILVGAAFAGGLLAAIILKRLGSD
jgi:hypothetical protein